MNADRFVWPRLPADQALTLRGELDGLDPHQLRQAARLHDPSSAPVPTGGPPVARDRIALVQRQVRQAADHHGWPADPGSDGEAGGLDSFDRDCGVALHEHMAILPADAAQEGVWRFLAAVVLPDVARWRERSGSHRAGFGAHRHVFGRLWWRVEVFSADLLVSGSTTPFTDDELRPVEDHPAATANPQIARAILRACADAPTDVRPALLDDVTLRVLRLLPSICLDALSPDDLDATIAELAAAGRAALPPPGGQAP